MSPFDTRRLSVPGTDAGIRTALDALEAFAGGHGLSKAVTWPVEVSLDEVLANVVRHGLGGRGEAATVRGGAADRPRRRSPGLRGRGNGRRARVRPARTPEPDTSLRVEDRPIGGLGIALVRKLMDEVVYDRRDGKNRLRMTRRLVAIEA